MTNSLIFFKKTSTFKLSTYDCCEGLGQGVINNRNKQVLVGIPNEEIGEFFSDNKNLESYLELITKAFNIEYSIASSEDTNNIDFNGSSYEKEKMTFVKISYVDIDRMSNKYFNAPYNFLRYIWYHHYSNIAIIATNLYNLQIFEDPMDILAIASSFQIENNRAILPSRTYDLPGLLYFRDKTIAIKELLGENTFFSVFYKYPIYFDPCVKINGSFFEDEKTTIKAKDMISKLAAVHSVEDIPRQIMKNFHIIRDHYIQTKNNYLDIIRNLNDNKYAMSDPLLLNTGLNELTFRVCTPIGERKVIKMQVITEDVIS